MLEYQGATACPQCNNAKASKCCDQTTNSVLIMCDLCGLCEYDGPVFDSAGDLLGWKHETQYGFGFLKYRKNGEVKAHLEPLHTLRDVAKAEALLRRMLRNRQVEETAMHLTRWNTVSMRVETVFGGSPEFLLTVGIELPLVQ